jgi:hypothetical protein
MPSNLNFVGEGSGWESDMRTDGSWALVNNVLAKSNIQSWLNAQINTFQL